MWSLNGSTLGHNAPPPSNVLSSNVWYMSLEYFYKVRIYMLRKDKCHSVFRTRHQADDYMSFGIYKRFESMLKGYVDKFCVWSPLSGPYGHTPTTAYLLLCNLKHFLCLIRKKLKSSHFKKNILKGKKIRQRNSFSWTYTVLQFLPRQFTTLDNAELFFFKLCFLNPSNPNEFESHCSLSLKVLAICHCHFNSLDANLCVNKCLIKVSKVVHFL